MGIITPQQSRASRGWLDWSQADLASKAGVSLSTVRDFEKGRRTPLLENALAIARAIESVGIVLLFDEHGNAVGIREMPTALDHGDRVLYT